jgi:hypothetical protein
MWKCKKKVNILEPKKTERVVTETFRTVKDKHVTALRYCFEHAIPYDADCDFFAP